MNIWGKKPPHWSDRAWNVYNLHRSLALVGGIGMIAIGIVGSILLIMWSSQAKAEDVTLSWNPPTESESCTNAGPVGELGGTRLWLLVADIPDPDITTYTFPAMKPGEYVYTSTAYLASNGAESRVSGKATKTVTTFQAAAGAQVFQPTTISSGFWMIPMGTLSADTACDVNTEVSSAGTTYHRVPLDNVQWAPGSTARPIMVVAECG